MASPNSPKVSSQKDSPRNSPRSFRFLNLRRGKRDLLSELHHPYDSKTLTKLLQDDNEDIDTIINIPQGCFNNCAPIHSIVIHKQGRERFDCLMSLLIHSKADVNLQADLEVPHTSALHLLTIDKDGILAAKALLAFGAEVNQLNGLEQTPVDLASENEKFELVVLLQHLGGKSAEASKKNLYTLQKVQLFAEKSCELTGTHNPAAETPTSYSYSLAAMVELDLEKKAQEDAFTTSTAVQFTEQTREMLKYRAEKSLSPIAFNVEGGHRVLFLDGGGMRALAQIESLLQLEQATGRRIVELFDWIVGTSTGAIIALGLVYANSTLPELRQLYFKIKDRVFSSPHLFSAGYNGKELEKLLQENFGSKKMTDVRYPKVLITAVNKERTSLKLTFFNNCFDEDFKYPISDIPVWEVARCTSAAPMHFTEHNDYVDGGVLANNPCEAGLIAIRDFYHERRGEKVSIAFVVSVGSGVWPGEKMGSTNLHQHLRPGGVFEPLKAFRAAKNVLSLLEEAMVESEAATDNCRSWCRDLGIPFYRFSTQFPGRVDTGERDNEKLVDMIINTKRYLQTPECLDMLDELVQLFHRVAQQNMEAKAMKLFLQSTVSPSDFDPAPKTKS